MTTTTGSGGSPSRRADAAGALKAVADVLAPHLGKTMATASVQAHAQKLGIDGASISGEQIDALLHKIVTGLSIFVGRDRAVSIAEEARNAVDTLES